MTLSDLIKRLEAAPQGDILRLGFRRAHSYRGYYEQLAFEPAKDVRVSDMLATAQSALGATFDGWKGGEYTMDEYTEVWLAYVGTTGETIGPHFLELMLATVKR